MKKLAVLLSVLCMTAHASPALSQAETLKIFDASGLAGKEFSDGVGFSKQVNTNQSVDHCFSFDGDKLCATTYIQEIKDINGDKQPEILVIDEAHGTYHYGNTGRAFALLTKTKTGYRVIAESMGIPTFLKTKGKDGYPDIEVGGPGFCFSVLRYDGEYYDHHRYEYAGKPCQR